MVLSRSKSRLFHKVRNYCREYCNKTTVHGLQYFGEKGRTTLEKLWWLIAIAICIGSCIYIILTMYYQYRASPIIVTFATKTTPIHKIPFPAVTICPESISLISKLNFSKLEDTMFTENFTEEELKLYEYATQICDNDLNFTLSNISIVENATDFYQTLHEVKPDFLAKSKCVWLGVRKKCSELFTEIITDEGICYSFNLLDRMEMFRNETAIFEEFQNVRKTSSNWMQGDGFKDERTADSYPYAASLPGVKNSLMVKTETYNDEIDYKCSRFLQGFKVAFHVPERYPLFQEDHILVPLEQIVVASVQPNMVTTSTVVQKYDPRVRMCYFPHEKYLRYFKIYTQKNCRTECWANYTLRECGCVSFFMPRTKETPVCGSVKVHTCVASAAAKLQRSTDNNDEEEDAINPLDTCDCLPLCTDLSYDVSTSQAHLSWSKYYQAYGISQNYTSTMHMTILRVYFKSGHFITSQRNELYGPIGFLANFGGIIALFTGASIVSVVEIIYFLSCRVLCNIKLFGSKHWLGHDD